MKYSKFEDISAAELARATEPGRWRMPQWISGLALLTAIVVVVPETSALVAASAQEIPKVTVRTVTKPAAPAAKKAPGPTRRVRTRTAGARTTYRRPTETKRVARTATPRRTVRRSTTRVAATPRVEPRSTRTVRRTRRVAAPRVAAAETPKTSTRTATRRTAATRSASRTTPRSTRRVRTARATQRTTRVAVAPRPTASASALNNRAYRLQQRGQHRDAEELLREALRKNPENAYAQYNLGWSLVRQGRGEEAVLYLKKTSQAQPRRWEPLDKLAEAYEQIGDQEKAAEARERARELRGGRRRSRTSRKGSSQDRTEAAPVYRSALTTVAWQQSTDRREEVLLREKREGTGTE